MAIGNEVLPGQTNDPPPTQAAVKNAFGIAIDPSAGKTAPPAAPNTGTSTGAGGAEVGKTAEAAPDTKAAENGAASSSAKSAAERAAVRALAGVGGEDDATDPNDPENAEEVKIPQAAMRGIKDRERQKGQLALARELGYETVEEMKLAAKRPDGSAKPKDPLEDPDTPILFDDEDDDAPAGTDDTASAETDAASAWVTERKELLGAMKKREVLMAQSRKSLRKAESEAKALKAANASLTAEMTLRERAWETGIRDTAFAMHRLREHLKTLPPAEVRNFDVAKFFGETLRAKHPALYEAAPRAANSTPAARSNNAAPPSDTRATTTVRSVPARRTQAEIDEALAALKIPTTFS